MEEWKEYKIGELCKISSSKRIFANEYTNSGIPFYRGKEIIEKQSGNKISTELYISNERFNEIKQKYGVPQKGDMLLTSVGSLGVPYVVQDETFYFKDGNLTWFSDFNNLDSRYLYYWFLSPEGKYNIDNKSIGSTQKALTIDALSKFNIKLPSLIEQKRIADFLSSLDDKIELNRQINDNLEQQAQALFKSWFVDFEPFKDGEFVDSELGMIPKGWKIGTLGDIADVSSGKRPPMKQSEMTPDINIPLIGASSVMGFTNEVLYNKAILVIGRVGTHGIVQRFNTPCWPSDNTLVIETTFYEYVNQILRVIDYKSLNRGSTQPLITQTDLKNQMVLIPNEKVLCDYNEIASKAMIKFDFNLSEINHLVTIRDTLLPRLMSGELKINEINC